MREGQPSLRERIRAGERLFGVFIATASCANVEMVARAGFDFVCIDCEHGPIGPEQVENMVRASLAAGVHPIVRVQPGDPFWIGAALDTGAHGVQVPHVSSGEDARSAVAAARFEPEGHRGLNPFIRAADYSAVPAASFCAAENQDKALILQVEGRRGIENLDAILETPGFDVLFLGPYDLSQSLGVPGQVRSELVAGAMRRAILRAGEGGMRVGAFVTTIDDACYWAEQGLQVVFFSTDTKLFLSACQEARRGLEAALARL